MSHKPADVKSFRTAKISEYNDLLGVCIYVTASELRQLGIQASQADAVAYTISTVDDDPALVIFEPSSIGYN
jgi:hypothetical protein